MTTHRYAPASALRLLGAAVALLAGCTKPAGTTQATGPSATPVAPAEAPPAAPIGKGQCPLAVVPGRALGPIPLGVKLDALAATGLPMKTLSEYEGSAVAEVGPFHVRTCGGVVREVWLDDLRKAPDCVSVSGTKVERTMSREAFTKLFASCHDGPPTIGGAFTECESGGLRIGYGMGDFLQVRVAPAGSKLHEECADVLDDGKAVSLGEADLAKLVQRTLDLDKLAPYWHRDRPGRDPLRMVKLPGTTVTPKLTIFGSPVVWIDAAQAKDGKPAFEITRIEATARRAVLSFRYPAEGVVGSTTFHKRGDAWELEAGSVAEK